MMSSALPTSNRKLNIFLSYAREDYGLVHEIYARLKKEEWLNPWQDDPEILLGEHWTSKIVKAINSADAIIVFLSNNSVYKEGFVHREMKYAWEKSLEKPLGVIYLIPIRLEDCEVPEDLYDIATRQWGDFFGEKKEETYQRLLVSLRKRLDQVINPEGKKRTSSNALAQKKQVKEKTYQKWEEQKKHEELIEQVKRDVEDHVRKEKNEYAETITNVANRIVEFEEKRELDGSLNANNEIRDSILTSSSGEIIIKELENKIQPRSEKSRKEFDVQNHREAEDSIMNEISDQSRAKRRMENPFREQINKERLEEEDRARKKDISPILASTLLAQINKFLIRWIGNCLAIFAAVWFVPGIGLTGNLLVSIFLLGLILVIVNVIVRPLAKLVGCIPIIFTLGLFSLLINTFLFWLTGSIGLSFGYGFTVDGFWPAFLGGLVVSVVSIIMGMILRDELKGGRK